MLRPLANPPEVLVVDRDGPAYARAFPFAIILDRETLAIRRGFQRHSFNGWTMFYLAVAVLEGLPGTTETQARAAMYRSGIRYDLSHRLRHLRRTLSPFGIGIESSRRGTILVTAVRPALLAMLPSAPAPHTERAA